MTSEDYRFVKSGRFKSGGLSAKSVSSLTQEVVFCKFKAQVLVKYVLVRNTNNRAFCFFSVGLNCIYSLLSSFGFKILSYLLSGRVVIGDETS